MEGPELTPTLPDLACGQGVTGPARPSRPGPAPSPPPRAATGAVSLEPGARNAPAPRGARFSTGCPKPLSEASGNRTYRGSRDVRVTRADHP